jgi:hypothetical protein
MYASKKETNGRPHLSQTKDYSSRQLCMFFGLRNSPATFQAMMDDYFRDMIDEGWIAIYMDDILIHARTKEDLEKRTKRVLE